MAPRASDPVGPMDPPRILVVDDDPANLVAIRAVLAGLGYPVVTVRSGEEALRNILRQEFACILLDVRMPGMDGYETAELIRSRDRCRHVPIIFLSGIDKDDAHLFRGYAAGAVDYVFKPVEPVILRSKVAVFARLYENAQEIRRQAEHERQLLAENLEVRAREAKVARELEQSLTQQSLVIDALPIALFVASAEGGYRQRRFVGGDLRRLCGPENDDDEGASVVSWLDRIHPDDTARFEAAVARASQGGSYEIEYRIRCADGSTRWLFERADRRAGDGSGDLFGLITDVSERRRLEEQLTHAQKLEAIGRMSGGIAHDFNNMLGVIIGTIDRIAATEQLSEKGERRLSLAMQAAESCADLTKRLLGFARRQTLEPRALDVAAELDRLRGLFERMLGETIRVHTEIEQGIPPVHLDPSQFESTIVNLLVNARDAMSGGGSLSISATRVSLNGKEAVEAGVAPGDFVRLSVADTGCGMDEATRSRAMEPFFTTKEPDRGTGLGLSTIYGFMKQSAGGLRIESRPGEGTRVHLYMPPAQVVHAAPSAAATLDVPSSLEGLRVLLVEDNDKVRDVAVSMLETMGCIITAAAGAQEALDLFSRGRFDLLFTDCVMPGKIDGPQLAALLVQKQPGLAVLLTSGYHEASSPLPAAFSQFLRKPYTEQQLAEAIRALIQSDQPVSSCA